MKWFSRQPKSENEPKTVRKLPKKPEIGQQYRIQTPKGIRIFEAKKEEGFGKYQIVSHKKKE